MQKIRVQLLWFPIGKNWTVKWQLIGYFVRSLGQLVAQFPQLPGVALTWQCEAFYRVFSSGQQPGDQIFILPIGLLHFECTAFCNCTNSILRSHFQLVSTGNFWRKTCTTQKFGLWTLLAWLGKHKDERTLGRFHRQDKVLT
jgi:hypothetical protein